MAETPIGRATALSSRIHQRLTQLHQATDLDTIAEALETLEPVLSSHFREEEAADGAFARLTAAAPAASGPVADFEREHAEILGQVQRLRGKVEAIQQSMDAVQAEMSLLVDRIRDHERHESEVVQAVQKSLLT
jgi:iron-sulfur cluster repair protein YtfE (RIC family)